MAEGVDPHSWQEHNEHGNTCHYPGCTLNEDEHAPAVRPKAEQHSRGADVTPPLRNTAPAVPDVQA